ncbi:ankyrin [Peniophora sp. CONT]|nr:ankyrin [Peniophora sp. CONT]
MNGHLDVVRRLLEYPAADGSNAAALRCGIRDNHGRTALHRAAEDGRANICRLLLEHGAVVDEEDNDGKTPLQLAKEERELDVVDVLLKHGATDVSGTSSLESESESAPSS